MADYSFGTDPRNEDAVTSYSSRGPARSFKVDSYGLIHYDNIIKPDLVAPGNKIIAAEAAGNNLLRKYSELETYKYSTTNMRLMYLSGTSMSAPMVSGAAALLLEANSSLTPNLVKMLLMYTAQPLAGFNTLDQGAGQLNVAGAVTLARIVRTDLLGLLKPSFGSALLTQSAPAPQTTVAGLTFPWTQGLVLKRATITGNDLINKYQVSYGQGYLLGDGVYEGLTSQSLNYTMWVKTVTLGNYLMKSDGSTMFGGSILLSNVLLLGDGFASGDGFAIGDCSLGDNGPGMK